MKEQSSLVLIAHGSKDPRWCRSFQRLEQSLKKTIGENGIYMSYMEFAVPTLLDVAKLAVSAGARKIRILPLFMAGGAHLDKDIPTLVQEVQEAFPDLKIETMGAIGEQPRFVNLIEQIAVESA